MPVGAFVGALEGKRFNAGRGGGLIFSLPLASSLVPRFSLGSPTATFARSTSAYYLASYQGLLTLSAINAPRWDYSNQYAGLLMEDAATNLLLQSQALDQAPWASSGTVVVTANAQTAPDGTLTGDRVSGATNASFRNQATSLTDLLPYALTWREKPQTTTKSKAYLRNVTDSLNLTLNWLASGAFGSYTVGAPAPVFKTDRLIALGWRDFLASFVASVPGGSSPLMRLYPDFNGTGATDNYWGLQLEAGGDGTSYIPTAGATASRGADSLSYAAAGNVSSTQGSVSVWVFLRNLPANGMTRNLFDIGSGAINEIRLQLNANGTIYYDVWGANAGGGYEVSVASPAAWTAGTWHNFTATYAGPSLAIYFDGSLLSNQTVAFGVPANYSVAGNINVGSDNAGGGVLGGNIASMRCFNVPLLPWEVKNLYLMGVSS